MYACSSVSLESPIHQGHQRFCNQSSDRMAAGLLFPSWCGWNLDGSSVSFQQTRVCLFLEAFFFLNVFFIFGLGLWCQFSPPTLRRGLTPPGRRGRWRLPSICPAAVPLSLSAITPTPPQRVYFRRARVVTTGPRLNKVLSFSRTVASRLPFNISVRGVSGCAFPLCNGGGEGGGGLPGGDRASMTCTENNFGCVCAV